MIKGRFGHMVKDRFCHMVKWGEVVSPKILLNMTNYDRGGGGGQAPKKLVNHMTEFMEDPLAI